MAVIVGIAAFVAFVLLMLLFSRSRHYRKILIIFMISSIILGCVCAQIFADTNTVEIMMFIFVAIPLRCLLELEKTKKK